MRYLIFLFSLLLLSSCATTNDYQQVLTSWQGGNARDLVAQWGYPDSTAKAPNGNTLYIYANQEYGTYPQYITPMTTAVSNANGQTIVTTMPGYTTGGGIYSLKCTTWFEISKNNIIVNTSMRGNNCLASPKQAQRMANPKNPLILN